LANLNFIANAKLPFKVREEEKWDPLWGAEKADKPSFAILDEQQRLASLYYAIARAR